MPRPISAVIHTAALANNLAVVRALAPAAKVWAVVKANAYGHGLARALPGLRGTDGFGLLDLNEAVKLRELGWAGPILLLEGFFDESDLDLVDRYSLTATVHCDEQLSMLEHARLSRPIAVQLKMNSGMNRLGFAPVRYVDAWRRARACASIGSITLMSHFANADGAPGVAAQLDVFELGADGLRGPRSLANSAATLWHPNTHADWVRPGIILYGGSPTGRAESIAGTGLSAAMTLASKLIAVQHIEAGDAVGYGSRFVARKPMRIGVVACGYADGYPRSAIDGTPVLVDGVRCRMVGRVSMDMLTVDLEGCPQAGVGSPVQLWGPALAIDEVAAHSDTIGYELMCALAARVPVTTD
jgi:alanine racemase